jgi:hypothetical protein
VMERAAAIALVSRIEATWSTGKPWIGARADEWIDALMALDEGAAGTAFARLRSSHPDAPNIATFMAHARAVTTTDPSTVEKCGWCDNTGWTQTADHVKAGVVYSGVEPCTHCPEGRAREVSETWTKAPLREFITDTEAERLSAAERQRNKPSRLVDPGAKLL